MIIDCHVHSGVMKNTDYSIEKLLASMKTANIDVSLLIANYSGEDNSGLTTEKVIQIAKENKNLKAIGAIEIETFSQNQISTLMSSLERDDILGVKFYPGYDGYLPDDERFSSLYEFCQKIGKPVIFHTGLLESGYSGNQEDAHPKHIEIVAKSYPKLKIVIAHIGNPWTEECARLVTTYEHVYADISGLGPTEYTGITADDEREIIRLIQQYKSFAGDFTKCLFGTDYPIYNQSQYLNTVNKISFTNEERDLLFFQNAKNIFNLN